METKNEFRKDGDGLDMDEKTERDLTEGQDYLACIQSWMEVPKLPPSPWELPNDSWEKCERLVELYFGAGQDEMYLPVQVRLEEVVDEAIEKELDRYLRENGEDLPPSMLIRAMWTVYRWWVGRMYKKSSFAATLS